VKYIYLKLYAFAISQPHLHRCNLYAGEKCRTENAALHTPLVKQTLPGTKVRIMIVCILFDKKLQSLLVY
jgi:hypothetical protein